MVELLALENVTARYRDGDVVVRDVSLTVNEASRVGLVGESGSGKTTLARVALALVEPGAGTVRYEGRPLDGAGRAAMRRECRMVFQNAEAMLNPGLTVRSLLTEPLRIHGGDTPHVAHATEVLRRVGGHEEWLARTPRQLSGGERRRVALARALVSRPRLLVADEPVAGLDVVRQAEILAILDEQLTEHAGSALIISHDLAVVERLCTEIHVMRHGELVDTMRCVDGAWTPPTHDYARRLYDASCELRADFIHRRGA